MKIDAPEICALKARVRAASAEFDFAAKHYEAWKPAKYDSALHARIGHSYAGNTFLVVRQALRREMLLSLMRLCTGAGQFFASLDYYVGDRIWRWLMKKHAGLARKRTTLRRLPSLLRPTRRVWREGRTEQFLLSSLKVERFRRGWMGHPAYAMIPGEPDA